MFVIKKWMLWVLLLVIMAFTMPDQKAHEKKLNINSTADKEVVQQVAISPDVDFRDYLLFSGTRINNELVSFGIFGFVFVLGSESDKFSSPENPEQLITHEPNN